MNTVAWTSKAVKQLLKLDRRAQRRIRAAVGGLTDFPETPNVKRLTNHQYGYRLRVGDYRVLFDFDGVVKIITIEEVKKRDEHTCRRSVDPGCGWPGRVRGAAHR